MEMHMEILWAKRQHYIYIYIYVHMYICMCVFIRTYTQGDSCGDYVLKSDPIRGKCNGKKHALQETETACSAKIQFKNSLNPHIFRY